VAGDEPAEAVGDDRLEPQWQLADVRQHVGPAVVAPARPGAGATGAGRHELGMRSARWSPEHGVLDAVERRPSR
jgi:hypothetical protein